MQNTIYQCMHISVTSQRVTMKSSPMTDPHLMPGSCSVRGRNLEQRRQQKLLTLGYEPKYKAYCFLEAGPVISKDLLDL